MEDGSSRFPAEAGPRCMMDEIMQIFGAICRIPHPSRGEAQLAAWILKRAAAHGIEARRDRAGNVILRKGASAGYEDREGVILQAHLDMVTQAAAGASHDFARDPIVPRPDPAWPGWITASGTTLGSDDGIGIALALAIMEDQDLPHGPLECLFTVNEEDGMDGAKGLEPGALRGSLLLNLDGEDSGEICVGCAGAARIVGQAEYALSPVPNGWRRFSVDVTGLAGGHTGADIHLGRANAIRVAARIAWLSVHRGAEPDRFRLVSIEGGTASNAIPRAASIVLAVADEVAEGFILASSSIAKAEHRRYSGTEPGMAIHVTELLGNVPSLGTGESRRILKGLALVPEGVLGTEEGDFHSPGGVKTSCCLSVISSSASADSLAIGSIALARSSEEAEKELAAGRAARAFELMGMKTRRPADSPAWPPAKGSAFLVKARDAYRRATGRDAKVTVTHGGLECALFGVSHPSWSMLCLGPTIRNPHSPDERLELSSVEETWGFLKELIVSLPGRG